MPAPGKSQQPRLLCPRHLDEVRQILYLHHYSIHTERADKKVNVPVVMARRSVSMILRHLPKEFSVAIHHSGSSVPEG